MSLPCLELYLVLRLLPVKLLQRYLDAIQT